MVDYRIEKQEGALIWKIELKKFDKDMRILVDDGCVALAFADGTSVGEFRPGEKKLLNEGGRLSKLYKKAKCTFFVFNREKPASVKWGVGKTPVTYEDRKLGGIALSMSAYGHCDVILHDAAKLWQKMPPEYTADNRIEAAEIERFIQRELIAKVAPVLSRKLSEIGDYTRVQAAVSDLGKSIDREIPDLEAMGLHIDKTVIEGLEFTDESKEIIEKHRASKVAKIETDIVHERAEQVRSMAAAVSGNKEEE